MCNVQLPNKAKHPFRYIIHFQAAPLNGRRLPQLRHRLVDVEVGPLVPPLHGQILVPVVGIHREPGVQIGGETWDGQIHEIWRIFPVM